METIQGQGTVIETHRLHLVAAGPEQGQLKLLQSNGALRSATAEEVRLCRRKLSQVNSAMKALG